MIEQYKQMQIIILIQDIITFQFQYAIIIDQISQQIYPFTDRNILLVKSYHLSSYLLELFIIGLVVDSCCSEEYPQAIQSERIAQDIAGIFIFTCQGVYYLLAEHVLFFQELFLEFLLLSLLWSIFLYAFFRNSDLLHHAAFIELVEQIFQFLIPASSEIKESLSPKAPLLRVQDILPMLLKLRKVLFLQIIANPLQIDRQFLIKLTFNQMQRVNDKHLHGISFIFGKVDIFQLMADNLPQFMIHVVRKRLNPFSWLELFLQPSLFLCQIYDQLHILPYLFLVSQV